jgi:hypothetical protein
MIRGSLCECSCAAFFRFRSRLAPSTCSICSCRTPEPLNNSAQVGSLRCEKHSVTGKTDTAEFAAEVGAVIKAGSSRGTFPSGKSCYHTAMLLPIAIIGG